MRDAEDHGEGGPQQHDDLQGISPGHGLDTAHIRINQGQDPHQGDTGEDVEARYDVQGDGRKQQDHAHAADLVQDEGQAAQDPDEGAETLLQVFISRRHPQAAELRDEEQGDDRDDQDDAEVEEHIAPIRRIRFRRNGHEGDGGQGGAEDAQAHDEPRDAPAALEIILRILLPLGEMDAHPGQQQEIQDDDRDIQPSHHAGAAVDLTPQHDGGTHAGRHFPAAHDEGVSVPDEGRRHRQDLVFDRHGQHGRGHRMIDTQHIVRHRGILAAPARKQDMIRPERRPAAGHDRELTLDRLPFAETRIPGPAVPQDRPRPIPLEIAAAEEIEAIVHPIALHHADGEGPGGRVRPGQFPAGAGSQIQGQEGIQGLGVRHRRDAAGEIDLRADLSARHV